MGDNDNRMICIRCDKARFPQPHEQCYRTGGMICSIDDANVGKYEPCRFEQLPQGETP